MNRNTFRVKVLDQLKGETPSFLAIGVFDGVHLGHRKLLENMIMEAKSIGARPAVLTFFPHPGKVISGRTGRLYLSTLDERIDQLAKLGLSLVITQEFDQDFRQTKATDFIDMLIKTVKVEQLWGANFSLGFEREGDYEFLKSLGKERGFSVHQFLEMVEWQGGVVSSSRIRRALNQGQIEEVNGCLGRPYALTGKVVHGDGRGKHIGIPTANLDVWAEQILPADGVYAAKAAIGEEEFMAAVNVGVRPTVNGHSLNIEAHLLDFDEDIYGQTISLAFLSRIRDEKKFPSIDALVAQIESDIQSVRSSHSAVTS